MSIKPMLGLRFGKLKVVEASPPLKDGTAVWKCLCDCGESRTVPGNSLRAGRNKSCGCASPKFTSERTTKHGFSRSRTYKIWLGMRQRCSSLAFGKTKRLYFDKGIRVCERWSSFELFLEDMGEAPSWGSIERIDGNKDYVLSNCKWASSKEQANNTTRNKLITYDGMTLSVSMWAERIGIPANTLLYRIRRGIDLQRAMQKIMPSVKRAS